MNKNSSAERQRKVGVLGRVLKETIPPNLGKYAFLLLCMIGLAASTAGLALMMRYLVNDVFVNDERDMIWIICGAIFAISLVKGATSYLKSIITAKIRRAHVADFQIRQFKKLMAMEYSYFLKRNPSEFVSDLLFAARGSTSAVLSITSSLVGSALTLLFLVGVMVSQDPFMSLVTMLIIPIMMFSLSFVKKRVRKLSLAQAQLTADVSSAAIESIDGIKTVKSFSLERKSIKGFKRAVKRLERSSLSINRASATTSPIMETLGGFVIGLFAFYAAWQTAEQSRTPGEIMAFMTAFLLAYEPAKKLAGINVSMQKQIVAVERLYCLLDEETEDSIKHDQKTGARIENGAVNFSNIKFSFEEGKPVLDGISLSISAGERVAFVGRSGSGKTTMINLILGFLKPDSGHIKIDGHDIRDLPYETLRNGVSLVAQDVFLFDGTIRENIMDGNPDADEKTFLDAVKGADVLTFAELLPDGLDTDVGLNGRFLSGGQRQRVSIARALIKDARIVIYDEATSALDGESERAVMSVPFSKEDNRTVICIAHRLSTIKNFDRIVVLDEGVIVDFGTFEELSVRDDTFKSIFHIV